MPTYCSKVPTPGAMWTIEAAVRRSEILSGARSNAGACTRIGHRLGQAVGEAVEQPPRPAVDLLDAVAELGLGQRQMPRISAIRSAGAYGAEGRHLAAGDVEQSVPPVGREAGGELGQGERALSRNTSFSITCSESAAVLTPISSGEKMW